MCPTLTGMRPPRPGLLGRKATMPGSSPSNELAKIRRDRASLNHRIPPTLKRNPKQSQMRRAWFVTVRAPTPISLWNLGLISPDSRARAIRAYKTGPTGPARNSKRRTDYRALGRAVYEPIPNNRSNVKSVGTEDLFSPNAPDDFPRPATAVPGLLYPEASRVKSMRPAGRSDLEGS